MDEEPGTVITVLAGVGLLIALVTLVLPWWSVTSQGGGFTSEDTVRPFNTGGVSEDIVSSAGVVGAGVLALVGILAAAGGLVLWLRAIQAGEAPIAQSPWLILAAGALTIMASLVAVATWPATDIGFWGAQGSSSAGVATAAEVGWYLSLVAGALLSVAGIGGLYPSTSPDPPR